MYEIKRENGRVVIHKGVGASAILNASEDSYVVFEKDGKASVSKVKDLPDDQLLLALSSAIPLKL